MEAVVVVVVFGGGLFLVGMIAVGVYAMTTLRRRGIEKSRVFWTEVVRDGMKTRLGHESSDPE